MKPGDIVEWAMAFLFACVIAGLGLAIVAAGASILYGVL